MKQLLFISLIMVLIGCGKDPSGDNPKPEMESGIGFATTVLSRGASVTNESIANFGVFGYRTGLTNWQEAADIAQANIFDNIEVRKITNNSMTVWDYGETKSWGGELGHKFTFMAYSPYATIDNKIVVSTGQIGTPKLMFTVNSTTSQQIDLLLATPVLNMSANTSPIMMKFKHALCCVGFKAFSTVDGIKLQKIAIKLVQYKGELSFMSGWNSDAELQSFEQTYDDLAITKSKDDTGATNISDPEKFFMMLPQNLTSNKTAIIEFTFSSGNATIVKEYVIKEDWTLGKAVTYTVDLTAVVEEPLDVTNVAITDWTAGASESGSSGGTISETTLTYNENGQSTTIDVLNHEIVWIKTTTVAGEMWNTEADGSGDYYIGGDKLMVSGATTLYNLNFVNIGGAKWLMSNLTGDEGTASEHKLADSPKAFGSLFKWGDKWVYAHVSVEADAAFWGETLSGASITPSTSEDLDGYNYGGLSGGRSSGDPCMAANSNFRTPTKSQCEPLLKSNSKWAKYQDVEGRFFGVKANSCSNTVIQAGCLFFPAASYLDVKGDRADAGSSGQYWSSSFFSDKLSPSINFYNTNIGSGSGSARAQGFSVRCVRVN